MPHFYRVTQRESKKDAVILAQALGKHLNKMGFPSETRVVPGGTFGYIVESTATPKQMTFFHKLINADPIRSVGKIGKDLDPDFRRHLIKAQKSFIKDQKADLAERKRWFAGMASRTRSIMDIVPGSKEEKGIGSAKWYKHMDEVVRKWTGWDSFMHMCRGSPTLRVSEHASPAEATAIREMRTAYRYVTGKEAPPLTNWDMKRNIWNKNVRPGIRPGTKTAGPSPHGIMTKFEAEQRVKYLESEGYQAEVKRYGKGWIVKRN
jgi:hypothetical protein